MRSYLVDTNVWSETLQKSPDPKVITWMRENESSLYVSTVTIGELKYGIDRLADGKRKRAFQTWLSILIVRMKGRVLSYNTSVATVWGQLQAKAEREGFRLPSLDSQIAATALKHSLVLATRNVRDFKHTGLRVENPFA